MDRVSSLSEIKSVINNSLIKYNIEYAKGHPSKVESFKQNSPSFMMKQYNLKSRLTREQVERGELDIKIDYIGSYAITINNKIFDRSIFILIRICDVMASKESYTREHLGLNYHKVDIEARDYFHAGVSTSTLKCIAGFNQHGNRNRIINRYIILAECPRCLAEEMWEHIVQYLQNPIENKVDFIIDLYTKLMKVKPSDIDPQIIKDMIVDIREYLQCGEEYQTN